MAAHTHDLRAEVAKQPEGEPLLRAVLAETEADSARAALSPADHAMVAFVLKLTRTPADMTAADVATLRAHGFDDVAVHDIVQITGLFNYYNRLADGLGIDPEPGDPLHGRGGSAS